jgi:hypothetical protein
VGVRQDDAVDRPGVYLILKCGECSRTGIHPEIGAFVRYQIARRRPSRRAVCSIRTQNRQLHPDKSRSRELPVYPTPSGSSVTWPSTIQ